MAEPAAQKMTFEEFFRLQAEGRYELVDGVLETLMPPDMYHGARQLKLGYYLQAHLGEDFNGILGTEIDFPTIPFHGRRPDILYLAPEHVTAEDWERGYPLHPPDLVVEVISEGDQKRDTVVKLREYAQIGIPHYWIVDPRRRTMALYVLEAGRYRMEKRLGVQDRLTSPLFPGLSVPLKKLFWP